MRQRNRTSRLAVLAACALLALAGATVHAAAGPRSPADAQHLAVPAYFYPGGTWDQLTAAAPSVGLAVANPASGPGTAFDGAYADAIRAAHDAGAKVIGYVDTGYFGTTGNRTRDGQTSIAAWTAQIHADIDTWYSLYGDHGLDGIFFDDALAQCGAGNQYADLYTALRDYAEQHSGATVVDNPGTGVEQCYSEAADILLTFEGGWDAYENWTPPAWQRDASPDLFWHLVYATDASRMPQAVDLSKSRNAGWVYVTPDDLPNPWDTLPTGSYWTDELARAGS